MKKTVLFDLDGTLTDSSQGIMESLVYMINELGYEALDDATLRSFIGPPLVDSLMTTYGIDEKEARQAVTLYRTHFKKEGLMKLTIYPGVKELLATLSERYTLALATSKTEDFAIEILQNLNLAQYFTGIFGADPTQNREAKAAVVAYALAKLKAEKIDTVMIGDRKYDIKGAKENGINALGVTYGFGSKAELKQAGADGVVTTVAEIPAALVNLMH